MALTVMERVEAGSIPEPNSGCWLWLGRAYESQRAHAYGVFSLGNKRTSVHRAAYEATHGPIPKGMVCRHTCDNASCVNPDHLLVGTQADNVRDMWERNRAHQQIDPSIGQRAAVNGNATMAAEPHRRARGDRHGKKAGGDKGEKNSQAVLTESAIREIRASTLPQRKIARQYGVHQKTIWRVKNDKSWTHIALRARAALEGTK